MFVTKRRDHASAAESRDKTSQAGLRDERNREGRGRDVEGGRLLIVRRVRMRDENGPKRKTPREAKVEME